MNLYPYQQKIVDEVLKNLKTKHRQMIVVPTGGGKTVIFCHIIKALNLKTLIVAHTKELISQCQNTIKKLNVPNVTVNSIQSVGMRMKNGSLGHFDLLIVDECHRGGAATYQKLTNYLHASKIIGVTATPFRSDGIKLHEIFGPKISPLTMLDMIESKLLCDFEGYRVKTGCSLEKIRKVRGDFIASALGAVINVKNRNELIVKEYLNLAPKEKALCFAINIKHSDELAKEFNANGICACSVHGEISKAKRQKYIEDFKSGKIQVLVNCQILTEGFDEPSITCLLMARPTCSKILFTQMIGRGSRLFPGKKVCKVIEYTDNEHDVSSIEDLLDSPMKIYKIKHGESLKEYAIRVKKELEAEQQETQVEKIQIIQKSFYEKPATPWQISYLHSLKVDFQGPITEFTANQLIIQTSS